MFDELRQIALSFPGVEEGTSFGTPAFRVRKKLLARLHDNGDDIVLRMPNIVERDMLLEANPATFHITDHYINYAYVLARLSQIEPDEFERIFEQAWRQNAGKKLITVYDEA